MLCRVIGHKVPPELCRNQVCQRAATCKIAAGLLAESDQIAKPTDNASLDLCSGGTDHITADILIQSGCDEVGQNADGCGRRRYEAKIAGMADVHTVWKQLLLQFTQNSLRCRSLLRQRFIEQGL